MALSIPAFLTAFSQVRGSAATPAAQPPVVGRTVEENVPPQSDNYSLGPDSRPNPANPAGSIFKFELTD